MALASWHEKANTSTIVPKLRENVTSFQHSYVATEYGLADCFGHPEKDQARNLIAVAHPDARAGLTEAAREMRGRTRRLPGFEEMASFSENWLNARAPR